jgi:hypothetical protein
MSQIKECIEDIDSKIKEASKFQDTSKISGLVIAKYILIGKLPEEEKQQLFQTILS